MNKFYQIIDNGCPDGFAFVRDYMGNKCFYGTMEKCKEYIVMMEVIISHDRAISNKRQKHRT